MKFFNRYSPAPSVGLEFNEPSMTEQHFKDECDINNIIAQYEATGVMPQGDRKPMFGDFDKFPQDLMSSRQMFDEATARFMELPSRLRKQFDNDPTKLLGWLQDPSNYEQAVEYGLLEKVAQKQPQGVSEYNSIAKAKQQAVEQPKQHVQAAQQAAQNVSSQCTNVSKKSVV